MSDTAAPPAIQAPAPLPERAPAGAPPALILGLGAHGLAVARSLGRHGVHVEAMDTVADQPHRHSRHCRALHVVPSLEDERLLDALLAYGRRRPGKMALFITMDRTVPVVSVHRERLAEHFVFNLPPAEVIDELMDKARLPGFLERSGSLYPRTLSIRGEGDLGAVAGSVGYPCILKPTERAYGFKAGVANTPAELSALYATARGQAAELVVQRLVQGEDSDVLFCFVYIGRDGQPRAVFSGRKLRQLPRGTGIAASAEGLHDDFLRRESLRLFACAGYRGFGSTEFRRDPASGQYFLIEFTVGRTDYNVGCAIANGVDLPYAGYLDLIGIGGLACQDRQDNQRRWVELPRELRAIRQHPDGSRWRALARARSPSNAFTVFDAGDPMPWVMRHALALGSIPGKVRRRLQRLWAGAVVRD